MGQAKNRGTKEQRVEAAVAAGRKAGAPERTEPYQNRMRKTTPALDRLWPLFKPFAGNDKTIAEIRHEAVVSQRALAAKRFAESQMANASGMANDEAMKNNATVIEGMAHDPAQAQSHANMGDIMGFIDIENSPFRKGGVLATEPLHG